MYELEAQRNLKHPIKIYHLTQEANEILTNYA